MQPEAFKDLLLTESDQAAGERIKELAGGPLDALVVLGSGLAETLDEYREWGQPTATTRLSRLPGVLTPVADGHRDELRIYRVECSTGSRNVAIALGRTHLYEGVGPDAVTALARAASCAGAELAVLCNANGCLRDWKLGDVMTIVDHANLSGTSPFDGTVFLDTSRCWDPELSGVLKAVTKRSGSYAFLRGPEYQTPLETRMLSTAGVDTVGMSTVLEALTLHALGVKVCGMSVVSDLSFAEAQTDPLAVVETAKRAARTVIDGLNAVLGL